ncbi:ATM interactor-like protein [Leptotrombidium deliense]|uniref:ATM interactor-like protein n=1 Tax=Leptotrombidium deliense TaxID=299467 RepID=A0A443SQ28_9ACAR|nr:ATM interactor-like protein [Leptotrombidium deliense]
MLVEQHFLNSHCEKKHICPKCGKPYSIDWQLKHHLKSCGLEWKCLSCHKVYKERLSLITHCKRHAHILPENAKIRKAKDVNDKLNTISLNVIVMPLIIAPQVKSLEPIVPQIKELNFGKIRPILPKPCLSDKTDAKTYCVQRDKQCNIEDSKTGATKSQGTHRANVLKSQIATQTEKSVQKIRASRSAQCPPLRAKRKGKQIYESAETQTLESILSLSGSPPLPTTTSTKSTSTTSPPKKSRTSVAVETYTDWNLSQNDSNCDSSALTKSTNPMLSQFNLENNYESHNFSRSTESINQSFAINEQSVQTDENKEFPVTDFTHIETQTTNDFINEVLDLNFSEDDILFTDLEFNDIETQTIWNNDEMTQTDEVGEGFQSLNVDDVLSFFEEEATCIQQSERLFSSIETQTQTNSNLLTFIPNLFQPALL